MGCIHSKNDMTDINPNIFRVSNIDGEGTVLWSGQLEISRTELTLYRKGKKPTQWPLQCLRRYGYDADLFSFEAGRRCDTGPGIYAFRCRRAETLFHMLQNYIQGRAYSTDENITTSSDPIVFSISAVQHQQANNTNSNNSNQLTLRGTNVIPRLTTQQQTSTAGRNNTGSGSTNQTLSPNGNVNAQPNQNSDFLTTDGNYLEPITNTIPLAQQHRFQNGIRLNSISSGPLSPDSASPGSPNSITNILEVTPLPNTSASHHGVSNLYQEFPINNNNNNNINNNNFLNNKKLSLDIPPQEQAPSTISTAQHSSNQAGNTSTDQKHSPIKFNAQSTTISPLSHHHQFVNQHQDSIHSYMNINIGNDSPHTSSTISSSTPTSLTNNTKIFGFYQTAQGTINDNTRCYENLEPILKGRYSKPDIFSKIDLPHLNNPDKSEPCTPTIGNMGQLPDRKVNYIVLDLNDKTVLSPLNSSNNNILNNNESLNNNSSSIENGFNPIIVPTTTISSTGIMASAASSNITNSLLLLPPESPKNASLGYATIDFNKTVALSNSTTPSSELDSEGSRKTRHSSNIPSSRHSNSISD